MPSSFGRTTTPSPVSRRKGGGGFKSPVASPVAVRPATTAGTRDTSTDKQKKPRPVLVAKRNNYDWIYGDERAKGGKDGATSYQESLDGADMPRASPFKKQAQYSFSKGGRWSEDKTRGASKGQTPGPIYDIGSTIGEDLSKWRAKGSKQKKEKGAGRDGSNNKGRGMMKGYSFPANSSDRANPETRRKILENQPGPGHYNIGLEHQVEARLQEADDAEASVWAGSEEGGEFGDGGGYDDEGRDGEEAYGPEGGREAEPRRHGASFEGVELRDGAVDGRSAEAVGGRKLPPAGRRGGCGVIGGAAAVGGIDGGVELDGRIGSAFAVQLGFDGRQLVARAE